MPSNLCRPPCARPSASPSTTRATSPASPIWSSPRPRQSSGRGHETDLFRLAQNPDRTGRRVGRASAERAQCRRSARLAADALADLEVVRVAVNQDYAAPDRVLAAGDEVALFPPVTGG